MNEITEINLFTVGDSAQLSTWSNLPYFISKTLLEKGIKLNRIDLSPNRFLNKLSSIFYEPFIKKYNKRTTYTYYRSKLHFLDARRRIKKAVNRYKNSDADIFLTFSFSSTGLTKKPIIQFCDWTYEYYIRNLENREPDKYELKSIGREDNQISGSSMLFLFFGSILNYMLKHYHNKNTYFFGQAINKMTEPDTARVMDKKKKSKI